MHEITKVSVARALAGEGHENKTGISLSPMRERMEENALPGAFTPSLSARQSQEMRLEPIREAPPVGTMPPPGTLTAAAKALVDKLRGERLDSLVDKMAERLAFERTGTRLYDALLAKHDAKGSFDGGPSREDLAKIRADELRHFHLLARAMEDLGADPTAVTPSADLTAVESLGIGQVLGDPRTDLAQGLHAILVAELADREGWTLLAELAAKMGHEELASKCRAAEAQEQQHLTLVRRWVQQQVLAAVP